MAKGIVNFIGTIFVIAGIWGFFQAPVLGLFEVDTTHNIIHIVTGVLALYFASGGEMAAKGFAKFFGIAYALVAIIGFTMGGDMILGLFHSNTADSYLHLGIAAVLLFAGFSSAKAKMM
jgi:hypothetical protein